MQDRIKTWRRGVASGLRAGALFCALTHTASAQASADRVILKDGSAEVGEVLEEAHAGVTLKPEKGPKKILAWEDIQTVEYAGAPPELASGINALNDRQFSDALLRFETILSSEDRPRPILRQQALFYTAYANERGNAVDDAIAGYKVVLEDFPTGRFLRSASENLLGLMAEGSDFAGAETALQSIAAGAAELPGFAADLAILRGRMMIAQQKPAEARERFEEAEKVSDAPAAVRQEARMYRATVLLTEGKRAEAEAIFNELKGGAAPARVQSGAWNGLGQILTEDGRSKRDAEKILDGLYAYLRTAVQYKPLPGEPTEEYERALAGAATCFKYISELEANSERKKLYAQRSREKLDQLQSEFPNSNYVQTRN